MDALRGRTPKDNKLMPEHHVLDLQPGSRLEATETPPAAIVRSRPSSDIIADSPLQHDSGRGWDFRKRHVEASRAIRQAEVRAARTMLERTEARFGLKPQRLAADSAYGAAPMLNWLVEEERIAPHIPVLDKSKREDGTFSREDFRYDESTDTYTCPGGKRLTTTGRINAGDAIFYRSTLVDCAKCHLKPRCCPKAPFRRAPRSIYEHARDIARWNAGTEAFERSRHDRKRIEMRLAYLKRILRLGRLRLRRPRGAQDEFTLAAIAQNLRRMAKLIIHPPPFVAADGAAA